MSQSLSLLCIRKSQELVNNPIPAFTESVITPGGASKNSWSGGEVFAIPNVVSSSLLSSADADRKCQVAGQNRYVYLILEWQSFMMAAIRTQVGVFGRNLMILI